MSLMRPYVTKAHTQMCLRLRTGNSGLVPGYDLIRRIEGTRARTYEGTGIGLAFVQELVRLHGGDVRVESAPGQGSTFTVTIPRGTAHLPPERIQVPGSLGSTGVRADAYAEEAQQWLPTCDLRPVDPPSAKQRERFEDRGSPVPTGDRFSG
jgi:Histidine kinase-, DNA gyrase B-, and HSP90-like ATPase